MGGLVFKLAAICVRCITQVVCKAKDLAEILLLHKQQQQTGHLLPDISRTQMMICAKCINYMQCMFKWQYS